MDSDSDEIDYAEIIAKRIQKASEETDVTENEEEQEQEKMWNPSKEGVGDPVEGVEEEEHLDGELVVRPLVAEDEAKDGDEMRNNFFQ